MCALSALALTLVITKSFVRYGFCDLALAALFGPLLVSGISLASFGEVNLGDAILGGALGLTTVWVFQVRQFEDLFRARAENFRTFLGYLSFDQARKVVIVEGVVVLLVQPAAAVAMRLPLVFLALMPVVSVPLVLTLQRFIKAASPLSSSLVGSSRWALLSHLSWTLWWILALGTAWL